MLYYIQSSCFLRFLLTVRVYYPSLVFSVLDSFQEYWSGILQNIPTLEFVQCLSHDQIGMCFWEEGHKGKVPFLSHHNKGTYYQHEVSLLMLTLITSLRECLSGFSTVTLLFLLLSLLYSTRGSNFMHLTLKEQGVTFLFLMEYLHKLFGILQGRLSVLPSFFRFNHLYQYKHMDVCFILCIII